MIKFLRKLFIKDYENISSPSVRTAHGTLASILGLIINLLLFLTKLIIGLISLSMSIVSDAFNNLTDMFSTIVNLIGFKLASRPADEKHPYGHERIEYICGMIISFIIVIVAFLLGYESIIKLINQEKEINYSIISFIILGISILFKLLQGLIYKGLGEAINSVSLKASKQDSFNDCISTGAVLICAIIQYFFNDLWFIDGAVSIVLAVFIFINAIKMISETASPLIGITPDNEIVKKIIKYVKSFDGVLGIHDVICHSYGPTKLFITLHVEVDGYESAFKSHDMIDNIEFAVNKKFGTLCTIHMDPIDVRSKEILEIKPIIATILHEYNKSLTYHDLRIVTGETHTNIIFDVVVPFSFKDSDKLKKHLQKEIKKVNKNYNVVINIDNDYLPKD